ncbi:unnamed protein product [Clonostachys rosea f. rosea IK726]|uniref:Uncharacterized protein n=1 Tax=Clonostachys rosea f. rosea IK726 TaxID=1349383 RepID=A0ACA9TNC9_BIOOC|nr:unnamed protein product [Clonostachys rosea f. rosea IK726]
MKFSIVLVTLLATVTTAAKLTQSQAETRLKAAGITATSSGGCTNRNVNEETVQGAITLKRACGCEVTVTGGTETGHASGTYSHWNGYKFDFRKGSGIDAYVKNTFTKIANRGDGYPQWKAASGNIYCDEGNHWDVTFYTNGG